MDPNTLRGIVEFILSLFGNKPAPTPVQAPVPATEPQPETPKRIEFQLKRKHIREDGVFSELSRDGKLVAMALEHSYGLTVKIPNGTFRCIRGAHRLHGMKEDFITFEIEGVAGHDNLLFHWGNWEKDSEGCVLLGAAMVKDANGAYMVTKSRTTFDAFMASLEGVDEFWITVS